MSSSRKIEKCDRTLLKNDAFIQIGGAYNVSALFSIQLFYIYDFGD